MQNEIAEALPVPRGADTCVAELAVVVPTFNERNNASEVVSRLQDLSSGRGLGGHLRMTVSNGEIA